MTPAQIKAFVVMYATSIMNLTDATWSATWGLGWALSPSALAITRQQYFSILSLTADIDRLEPLGAALLPLLAMQDRMPMASPPV
jgi:hypothetical protein